MNLARFTFIYIYFICAYTVFAVATSPTEKTTEQVIIAQPNELKIREKASKRNLGITVSMTPILPYNQPTIKPTKKEKKMKKRCFIFDIRTISVLILYFIESERKIVV